MTLAVLPGQTHQHWRTAKVSDILSNVSADVVLAELTNQIGALSRENAILKAMTQKLRQQLTVLEHEMAALRSVGGPDKA